MVRTILIVANVLAFLACWSFERARDAAVLAQDAAGGVITSGPKAVSLPVAFIVLLNIVYLLSQRTTRIRRSK